MGRGWMYVSFLQQGKSIRSIQVANNKNILAQNKDDLPKMEDDQNGRRPKWKTTKTEYDQNGRRPKRKTTKWKTAKLEDDQNGRPPKLKTTKMEDDQNGRRTKWKSISVT